MECGKRIGDIGHGAMLGLQGTFKRAGKFRVFARLADNQKLVRAKPYNMAFASRGKSVRSRWKRTADDGFDLCACRFTGAQI